MNKDRKIWERPQLVVLVRNKPEEAVLAACKYLVTVAKSSGAGKTSCTGAKYACVVCNQVAIS